MLITSKTILDQRSLNYFYKEKILLVMKSNKLIVKFQK